MASSKYQALIVATFVHILFFSAHANLYSPSNPNPTPNAAEYLVAHNQMRQIKGVTPLKWDEKLAKYAQAWAEQRINDCDHKHHSGGPYGENTYWEQYDESTPAMVTRVWTSEERNYDQSRFECKCKPETSLCMCGHYTQVVWGGTERVGCGNVTCNNEKGLLVVCSYDPPGNYENENPFGKAYRPTLPLLLPLPHPHAANRKKRSHRHRGAVNSHRMRRGRGV